jgi:EmrB/QacA subfamily drug resistance transporter
MTVHEPVAPADMRNPAPTARRIPSAVVLAVLCVATFLAQLDVWITNVGLPAIGRGVAAESLSVLSWVLTAYAIVYAALLVPAGRLADRYGGKAAFLLGLTVFAAASLGAGLSNDLWVLIGFRVLQAAGAAVLTPSSLGLVLTSAPPAKVTAYVKIWVTTGALSAACGPIAGGTLIQASWRWLFLINIPIALGALVVAGIVVPNTRHERSGPFPDIAGGLLMMAAVAALCLGVVKAPDWGWTSGRVIISLAAAAVALAAFLLRSARHAAPVIQLNYFRDRVFTASNLVAMLAFGSFGLVLLSAILWMQGHWGYSPLKTGFATVPAPLMFAVGAGVAERLVQKGRARVGTVSAAGLIIAAAGAILLVTLVQVEPSYAARFLPGWLLFGLGLGLAIPAAVSTATVELPPEEAATGSAIVQMSAQLGSVIGVSVLVAILGTASAAAPLGVYHQAWWVSFAVGLSAVLAALGINQRSINQRRINQRNRAAGSDSRA